jgi:hypothetical protein
VIRSETDPKREVSRSVIVILVERKQTRKPTGLAAAEGKLYVADTNNHAIRVVDLASGSVETLDVRM